MAQTKQSHPIAQQQQSGDQWASPGQDVTAWKIAGRVERGKVVSHPGLARNLEPGRSTREQMHCRHVR